MMRLYFLFLLIACSSCAKDDRIPIVSSSPSEGLNGILANVYGDGSGGLFAVKRIDFTNDWSTSIVSTNGFYAWFGNRDSTLDMGFVRVNGAGLALVDMTGENKVTWYSTGSASNEPLRDCYWETGNNGDYGPIDLKDTTDYPKLEYFTVPYNQKLRSAFNIAFKSEPCDFVLVRLKGSKGNILDASVRDGAATVSFNATDMEILTRDTLPIELLVTTCRMQAHEQNQRKYYTVKQIQHRFVLPVVAE